MLWTGFQRPHRPLPPTPNEDGGDWGGRLLRDVLGVSGVGWGGGPLWASCGDFRYPPPGYSATWEAKARALAWPGFLLKDGGPGLK